MSDLTDHARAEAERRWPRHDLSRRPAIAHDWLDEGMADGFVLGAEWGRADLLLGPWEDPTEAEVDAAAEAIHRDYCHECDSDHDCESGVDCDGICDGPDEDDARWARAALLAARDARRAER